MDGEAAGADIERGEAAGGTASGPELIDDAAAPILPPSFVDDGGEDEKRKEQGNIEQIHDDVGPAPPVVAMVASREDDFDKKPRASGMAPRAIAPPQSHALFVSSVDPGKKKAASAATPRNRDSIIVPTIEDIEGHEAEVSIGRPRGDSRLPANRAVANADVSRPPPLLAPGAQSDADTRPTLAPHQQSTQLIPEAFLVEEPDEGEVVIATRALPWWKLRKVRYLLCAVFVVVVALAIALGSLAFGRSEDTDAPTLSPSTWPSMSQAPSSRPSTCAHTVSSDAQLIELQLEKPLEPKVAVDGSNMGVVVDDEGASTTYTIFFALKDGEWVIRNAFRMGTFSVGWNTIALDGKTAFVGLPESGSLSVYEQNEFGFWEKVEDPFALPTNATDALSSFYSAVHFGSEPDIDGDLACIGAAYATYFFRREGLQWVPFDSIDVDYHENQCSISGKTIAIFGREDANDLSSASVKLYKYSEEANQIEPIQDPIPVDRDMYNGGSLALSGDYLLFTDAAETFIYKRDRENGPFTLHQQLSISARLNDQLAFDGGMLALGSASEDLHVFVEQNGYWEVVLELDQPFDLGDYDNYYKLSGRQLLATWGNEIYAMDVERCVPTPTQAPSISMAPTVCYPLEVTVVYDMTPTQNSWDLRRVGQREGVVFQYSADDWCPPCQGSLDCYTRIDRFCLDEGEYEFTLYDAYRPNTGGAHGIISPGHYNVSSGGVLIAHGGAFQFKETRAFQLPLGTAEPSSSMQPSAMPSISSEPTDICDWVTILIIYDDYPEETSYRLDKIGASGLEGVRRYSESEGSANHTQTICLTDGSYNLTIYDSAGDGILLPGYYTLTSSTGEVIAGSEGRFTYSETTIFSIPFPSSPSEAPSTTQTPSASQRPSAVPSFSVPPSKSATPTRTPKPSPWPTYGFGKPWEEMKWWTPYPTTHYPTYSPARTPFPTPTARTPFPTPTSNETPDGKST